MTPEENWKNKSFSKYAIMQSHLLDTVQIVKCIWILTIWLWTPTQQLLTFEHWKIAQWIIILQKSTYIINNEAVYSVDSDEFSVLNSKQ